MMRAFSNGHKYKECLEFAEKYIRQVQLSYAHYRKIYPIYLSAQRHVEDIEIVK